jgi:hypothetical protein
MTRAANEKPAPCEQRGQVTSSFVRAGTNVGDGAQRCGVASMQIGNHPDGIARMVSPANVSSHRAPLRPLDTPQNSTHRSPQSFFPLED